MEIYDLYKKADLCEDCIEKRSVKATKTNRAIRRFQHRRIKKRNLSKIKTENYIGFENKPMSMCCLIPSKYKKMRRRKRRSKEKQAMKLGKLIPLFKKSDIYDWW